MSRYDCAEEQVLDGLWAGETADLVCPCVCHDADKSQPVTDYQRGWRDGNRVGCGTADAVIRYLNDALPGAIQEALHMAESLRDAQAFEQDWNSPTEPQNDTEKIS